MNYGLWKQPKRKPLFYEENRDKACALMADQFGDSWTEDDILKYFWMLGYDLFFEQSVIKPYFAQRNALIDADERELVGIALEAA